MQLCFNSCVCECVSGARCVTHAGGGNAAVVANQGRGGAKDKGCLLRASALFVLPSVCLSFWFLRIMGSSVICMYICLCVCIYVYLCVCGTGNKWKMAHGI